MRRKLSGIAEPSYGTKSKAGDGRGQGGDKSEGDKVQLYTHAWLVTQSNAMIGPWLVAQAKRQIAERYSQVMSKGEKLAVQGLLLNETHAQNGAAK
jgi:hypothetical protein